MKKLSLNTSGRFWLEIFFISFNKIHQEKYKDYIKTCRRVCIPLHIIQFFINIALVLCSSLCPIVSNVYMILLCKPIYFRKFITKVKLRGVVKGIVGFFVGLLSHSFPVIFLYLTYKYTFNVFFYGISYAIQFSLFTLLLAIPRLPEDSLVFVIFIGTVTAYIYRFVYQFVQLYKTLLETILDIRKPTKKIPIEDFNKIVASHFPLVNEVFYLIVKILFCCLFFIIVYENLETAGYFKTPFGLNSVLSVLLLFGPPRHIEELLMTDFTSRVHLKEDEIMEYLQKGREKNVKTINKPFSQKCTDEEIDCLRPRECTVDKLPCCGKKKLRNCTPKLKCCFLQEPEEPFQDLESISLTDGTHEDETTPDNDVLCCENCKYLPWCFWVRWLCVFFFGCCGLSFDKEGRLECFRLHSTDSKSETNKYRTVKFRFCCIKNVNELAEDNKSGENEKRKNSDEGNSTYVLEDETKPMELCSDDEENKTFQDETIPKELYSDEENKTFQDETILKESYSDEENKTFQDETIPLESYNNEENKVFQKVKFVGGTDETKVKEVQNKDDDDSKDDDSSKSDGNFAEDKDAKKQEETHL